jgi:pimeloyl-ACP methyl ester carboxylesterase
VVIPGLGASWNPEALLSCDLSNTNGTWTLAPYVESAYKPLLDALTNAGINHQLFAYDWRQEMPNIAPNLTNFLQDNLAAGQSASLVGHSLGGLVGRAYLEKEKENNRLDKLLTAGSPHRGAPAVYYPWEGGEVPRGDFSQWLAINLLIYHCRHPNETPRQVIQRIAPSLNNLLPIDPYLKDWKTGSLKPIAAMIEKNRWLPTPLTSPFFGVKFGTLSGNGFPTLQNIKVKPRGRQDELLGNWIDGKPTGKENTKAGDGTVLAASSRFEGAENFTLNQSHGGLIASSEGINKIFEFLGLGTYPVSSQFIEPQSALLVITYPAQTKITGPDNRENRDNQGLIAILDPKKGEYRLKIKPQKEESLVIIGQFIRDKVFWKEYPLKDKTEKLFKFTFNPSSPKENPLNFNN